MTYPAAAPFMDGRTAANAVEVTGSGISRRLFENAVGRRHWREGIDGETARRRPALRDIIARVETDAGSNGAHSFAQLRAVVASFETPADQLLAKYRGRPIGPAHSTPRTGPCIASRCGATHRMTTTCVTVA